MKESLDFIDYDNLTRGIDYSGLTDRSYKDTLKDSLKKSLRGIIWFFCLFLYLETVFHIWSFHGLSLYFILKLILCIPSAVIMGLLTSYFPAAANRVVTDVLTGISIIVYVINTLYHAIFKVFFSLSFADRTNMKVVQYYREILKGIADNWFVLLLIVAVPTAALVLLNHFRILKYRKVSAKCIYIHFAYLLASVGLICLIVPMYGKDSLSPYDLMKFENISEFSMERLGVTATHEIEIRNMIIPRKINYDEDLTVWVYDPDKNKTDTGASVSASVSSETTGEVENTEDPEGTENGEGDTEVIENIVKEIDRSPNMLDIDFVSLAESEKNENVAAIHRYFASVEPSYKNEYTGMFKG
nr:hypothetical protein [Lachnospiraceae bacterium]